MEIIFAVKECFFILLKFPHGLQHDTRVYGSVCIRMIAKYYSRSYSLQYLREHCFLTHEGISQLSISDAAGRIGMKIVSADTNYLFRKIESEFVKNQSPKFG